MNDVIIYDARIQSYTLLTPLVLKPLEIQIHSSLLCNLESYVHIGKQYYNLVSILI